MMEGEQGNWWVTEKGSDGEVRDDDTGLQRNCTSYDEDY
jgi:hypothetical protein